MILQILGVRVKNVLGLNCKGENEYVPAVQTEYEVALMEMSGSRRLYLLSLSESSGMCSSGYTTASWGHAHIDQVREIGPLTHIVKRSNSVRRLAAEGGWDPTRMEEDGTIDINPGDLPDKYECSYLSWDRSGGDEYYPCGGVDVNLDMFEPTGRLVEQPMIHVFFGESCLGKSSLAPKFQRQVYETDKSDEFNEEMVEARIIVLGNKYGHTIHDLKDWFKKQDLSVLLVPVFFGAPL